MATDIFVRQGLTQPQMAEVAQRFRREFEIAHVALVDIVEILEFKIPKIYPNFHILIRSRDVFAELAMTEAGQDRIIVREDVYNAACEGDPYSRFVLAHELGHFLLHKGLEKNLHTSEHGYAENISNLNALESAERQADIFARHFLIHPALAFKNRADVRYLSELTGTPYKEASAAATIAKRPEMTKARTSGPHL